MAPCGMDFDDLESEGTPGGDLDADFNDRAPVSCPYCGESSELFVDPVGGAIQEYVEDCGVCCQPWHLRVRFDEDGQPSVTVTMLGDE